MHGCWRCMNMACILVGEARPALIADGLKRAADIGLGNVGAVCFLKTIWAGGGFS